MNKHSIGRIRTHIFLLTVTEVTYTTLKKQYGKLLDGNWRLVFEFNTSFVLEFVKIFNTQTLFPKKA